MEMRESWGSKMKRKSVTEGLREAEGDGDESRKRRI